MNLPHLNGALVLVLVLVLEVVVCVFLNFASPERETTILHQLLNTGPLVSNVSDFVFIQIALIVGANQTTRMPYSSSVLLCPPLSQKIRITSVLAVFLKLGQMDFSKGPLDF